MYLKEDVIKEIKYVRDKIGKMPTKLEFDQHTRNVKSNTIAHNFGWKKLLKELGYDYARIKITKEDIRFAYKKAKQILKRTPTKKEVGIHGRFAGTMVNHVFGDYKTLCHEFGDKPHYNVVDKEDMKERYEKLKETLGRIPTRQEMSYNMRMEKKCGKWCDFIKDMGDTPVRDTYSKKKLINILKNFHTMTGKIPDSTDIIKPNSKVFQNEFGSWNNALQEAGFEVNQRTYIADDKHVCNSKMELYIDNLLNKLNIKHKKETKYPKDEKYNKHEKKRCDWKIDDTYVEYLGCLTHNDPIVRRKYRKSMNEKAMMCIENGWNFIHITPDKLINIRNDIISEFRGN
jgi:hypothetical protein